MKTYLFNLVVLYTAFFIAGALGLHHFCRGKFILGFIYMGTLGLLGLGLLFDFFAIPFYAKDL
tara:strand:+ start:81 stop:269 length:189 start_codon:yes stop_codon:yes gene_type:complete